MSNLPVWFEEDFSNLKKNLWGALRAFVDGFIASLVIHLTALDSDKVINLEWWIHVVLISGVVSGLMYLGKWLRDKVYSSPFIQKIPI